MGHLIQEFKVGEQVEIRNWVGSEKGTIAEAKVIYHYRLEEYTWGYRIDYEISSPVKSFIPQCYLRKLSQSDI